MVAAVTHPVYGNEHHCRKHYKKKQILFDRIGVLSEYPERYAEIFNVGYVKKILYNGYGLVLFHAGSDQEFNILVQKYHGGRCAKVGPHLRLHP
jgi:hypothetical protein